MRKYVRRIYSFVRYNPNKFLYMKTFLLSGYYRLCIVAVPMKRLQKAMGIRNEESAEEESAEFYRKAAKVSHAVNRVCRYTPWQSKCLVRALTARHLLKKLQVPSTLYLGVGECDHTLKAHAWVRCGKYYVSGGDGKGYTSVAKFRT